jgi:anti-sigma B factor antagonist
MKEFQAEVESFGAGAKYKIFRLKGEMVLNNYKKFEDMCDKELPSPPLCWVFDCRELEYVSSAGFGALMRLAQRFQALHGRLVLFGVSDGLMKVFKLLGLVGMFVFYRDEAEAIQGVA